MGRVHAAFGISLPANAADAHETKRKHTTACANALLFKNPPKRCSNTLRYAERQSVLNLWLKLVESFSSLPK
jgi:hypothetical protein